MFGTFENNTGRPSQLQASNVCNDLDKLRRTIQAQLATICKFSITIF